MKKLLFLFAFLFAFNANASTIPEGAIVKTANNPDVYIVKYNAGKQYKRLVLNPLVFKSYGHLKWENLLTVSPSEMDSFLTSDLVRVDGSTDIYQLVPEGDNGGKYLLTSTQGYDTSSIYTINGTDFGNYEGRGSRGAKIIQEIVKPTPIIDNTTEELERINNETEKNKQILLAIQKISEILEGLSSDIDDLDTYYYEEGDKFIALNKEYSDVLGLSPESSLFALKLSRTEEYLSKAEVLNNNIEKAKRDKEALLAKREKIVTIFYKIKDYIDYGTILPAADRAYLNSLGISI